MEQTQVNSGAFVQLSKMPTGCLGIAIGFPTAAAGEVAPLILDETNDIRQGIAQKNADLMREIRRTAEPPRELAEQNAVILRRSRKNVTFLREKFPHGSFCKDGTETGFPIDIDEILAGADTAFQNLNVQSLSG